MRIACPGCSAEYEVPDALLAAGPRLLKCARCATSFEAAAPGAGSRPASAPLPAEERASTDTGDRPPPVRGLPDRAPIDPPLPSRAGAESGPPRRLLLAAWGATILAVAAAIWAALAYRAAIMEAWPPATRLYQALGLG
jgi:predicted Zn finger-like uncharacterized protein